MLTESFYVPFVQQEKATECVYACASMIFQYDGLDVTPNDLREIRCVDHDKLSATDVHELAELVDGVNDKFGKSYKSTCFTNRQVAIDSCFEDFNSLMRAEKSGMTIQPQIPMNHKPRHIDDEIRKGSTSIRGLVESYQRPVMTSANGHMMLVTGFEDSGNPIVHDPLMGPNMKSRTNLHNLGKYGKPDHTVLIS